MSAGLTLPEVKRSRPWRSGTRHMYQAYRAGDWKSAATLAADCLQQSGELGLGAFYQGYQDRIAAAAGKRRSKVRSPA